MSFELRWRIDSGARDARIVFRRRQSSASDGEKVRKCRLNEGLTKRQTRKANAKGRLTGKGKKQKTKIEGKQTGKGKG